MKVNDRVRAESIEKAKKLLPPGSVVYTVMRHRPASGMLRSISSYTVIAGEMNGKTVHVPFNLDWLFARILGWSEDDSHGGVKVKGCGMDMGFHLVYSISCALYGFPNGVYSHDGAYALRHEWL